MIGEAAGADPAAPCGTGAQRLRGVTKWQSAGDKATARACQIAVGTPIVAPTDANRAAAAEACNPGPARRRSTKTELTKPITL